LVRISQNELSYRASLYIWYIEDTVPLLMGCWHDPEFIETDFDIDLYNEPDSDFLSLANLIESAIRKGEIKLEDIYNEFTGVKIGEGVKPSEIITWAKENSWCQRNIDLLIWDEFFPKDDSVKKDDLQVKSKKRRGRKKIWNEIQIRRVFALRKLYKNTSWKQCYLKEEYKLYELGINSEKDFRKCYDAARKSTLTKS